LSFAGLIGILVGDFLIDNVAILVK